MNNSTISVFGKRALEQISAADYIDWAIEMLMQDYDSPNLRILAGLDRRNSIFEVEAYFLRSMKELNIEELEPKTAIRAYVCEIAKGIIDGSFSSPMKAVENLYRMWVDTDYDFDCEVWIDLNDALFSLYTGEFPYTYPSATLENIDDLVKQEAARFIAKLSN